MTKQKYGHTRQMFVIVARAQRWQVAVCIFYNLFGFRPLKRISTGSIDVRAKIEETTKCQNQFLICSKHFGRLEDAAHVRAELD